MTVTVPNNNGLGFWWLIAQAAMQNASQGAQASAGDITAMQRQFEADQAKSSATRWILLGVGGIIVIGGVILIARHK